MDGASHRGTCASVKAERLDGCEVRLTSVIWHLSSDLWHLSAAQEVSSREGLLRVGFVPASDGF